MKKLIKRDSQPYIKMCPDLDQRRFELFKGIKRQYTITCEQDLEDIIEGFCPYYAIFWSNKVNSNYWEGKVFKHRPEYVIQANLALESLKSETDAKTKKTVRFDIFNEILFYEKHEKIMNYDLYDYLLEDYFEVVMNTESNEHAIDITNSRHEEIQNITQNLFSDMDMTNSLYFF